MELVAYFLRHKCAFFLSAPDLHSIKKHSDLELHFPPSSEKSQKNMLIKTVSLD